MNIDTAEPVALIGAGALGTFPGHHLVRAGHPAIVCGQSSVDCFVVTDDSGIAPETAWVARAAGVALTGVRAREIVGWSTTVSSARP
jgi:3-hydroxyisobutyrate dehydrogenase-like beta-hydroxyacid dehydrogenase